MPLVQAKPIAEVPPGATAEFQTPDAIYAICNVGGAIYCVDGICPHSQGPLSQGTLHGATIVCPWHGWEFDVRTGAGQFGDECLKTYPTTVKDDYVFVELP